jgi:PAS domain-containing protein
MLSLTDRNARALLQALPGVFVLLDDQLSIVDISDAYALSTMIERDRVVGKNMFEVFPDNPDDPNADGVRNLQASLQRVIESLKPDTMAVQRYDVRKPLDEGGGFDERYWSVSNAPVLDEDGQLRFIIHKAQDVTEFIQLKRSRLESHLHDQELTEKAQHMEAEFVERTQEVASTSALLKTANRELHQAKAAA